MNSKRLPAVEASGTVPTQQNQSENVMRVTDAPGLAGKTLVKVQCNGRAISPLRFAAFLLTAFVWQSASIACLAQESVPVHDTQPGSITVPAGTKVLLALRSGVNTRNAQVGDGVYLSSTFPVVVGARVAIPAGVYVQGVIDRVQRAGRVKGRAEVSMHFTTMIFPNESVVQIPGALDSLPGATDAKVKDGEGNIEQAGSKGKDAGTIARGAEAGAGVGSIGGAIGGRPLAGAGYGALAGGVTGLIYTLLTRGNDVNLEQGETVQMVLQRPLVLTPVNLTSGGGVPMDPSAQKPMAKPGHNQRLICPPGSLGCP